MNPIVKNILAVIAGVVAGSIVNMGFVVMGHALVPPPAGVDPWDMDNLKANFHLFEARHFIMPFIAHAAGTLVGAFTAAKIAANRQLIFAMVVGAWFLYGGISMVTEYGGPMWFRVLDLAGAYLPMTWLGWKLSGK